jgi:spore maturation protein CgeB
MELRLFAHSWLSDWNHGNAHFLRGLARALVARGHSVRLYEPMGGWSLSNLFRYEPLLAAESVREFRAVYPELDVRFYYPTPATDGASATHVPALELQLEPEVRDAHVVLVHEWNDPTVLHALAALKRKYGFLLLFHDTHHRAYSDPAAIARFPLDSVDAVLAFGESIRRIYERDFRVRRSFVFHEAADSTHFMPHGVAPAHDVVWIGNWGDEERTREIRNYLLEPARSMPDKSFVVHGVRYPEHGRRALREHGVGYKGYLPNLRAPRVYSGSGITLHIPRGPYANGLGGIPTIRVFEALCCGTALLCSPWQDSECLFEPGRDFLIARNPAEMSSLLASLLRSPRDRAALAQSGRQTVLARHTCGHRAAQLEEIWRLLA